MLCQSSQSVLLGGIALFLPLIREDLGLTFTQAGTLAATSTLIYAFMQIPSGFLADRLGPRRLFIIGLAGTTTLAITFALVNVYWLLLANQALSGFFRALVFAPGLLLMTALFPEARRATALGLYVTGGLSSNVLLNLLGPLLVEPLGWGAVFIIFGLLGMVALAVFWRRSEPDARRPDHAPPSVLEGFRVFRHPVMLTLGAIQFVRLAVLFGIATWLPTLLVDSKGYSLQTAGVIVAFGAIAGAPANLLGGYVSDRLRRPLAVIAGSLSILMVCAVALVHVRGLVPILLVVGLISVFTQFYFGSLFSVPITMLGARTAGLTSGIGNFFANAGGFTFIFTLGAVRDGTGSFDAGLYTLAGACALGVLLVFALSRMRGMQPPVSASPLEA